MRHAAFDVFKIAFALGCLALFGVDAPACGTDVQMRRWNFHIGANFMVEAELFVDVGRRDLARRNCTDGGSRAGHAVAAGKAVKQDGADNDLLDRIAADPVFGLTRADIDAIIAAGHFTGLAPEPTRAYVAAVRAALAADPTRAAALATPDDTKVLV